MGETPALSVPCRRVALSPRLVERLAPHVHDRVVLNLIGQYLRRVAERGGMVETHRRGLPLGSSLSPVLGAFFLGELDDVLERDG